MRLLISTLLFIPLLSFGQVSEEMQEKYNDPAYIKISAITTLQLFYYALKQEDYRMAKSFVSYPEDTDVYAALADLMPNEDITQKGIVALKDVGTLVSFEEFNNKEANILASELNLDTRKCWAIQVASDVADCWFYFDGTSDQLLFLKLRNIRVKE